MKWLGLLVVVGAIACGDDVQPGDDGTGTLGSGDASGSTSVGVVTSTVGTGTAGTDDDTTGSGAESGTGDSASTGGSDGGEASSTGSESGESSSDGSESTGAQGNVVYTAQAVIGALDRIRVFKEDLDDDRCTWLTLVSPAIGGQYDVTTPEGWSVESIQASDVGDACGSRSPAMFAAEVATSAEGSVELGAIGPGGVYPCEVSVDVTATFAGIVPGVPPVDVLDASAIPVDGC